jgi:hypothetical protein
VSEKLTWTALNEAGQARTATNRPAFPLKLPRWSCNLRSRRIIVSNLLSKWRFLLNTSDTPGGETEIPV